MHKEIKCVNYDHSIQTIGIEKWHKLLNEVTV